MDCQEIKNIIPRYFQHTASEEEVKAVEEHLCVCHECRLALGELMDKMEEAAQPAEPENQEEDVHVIPESGGESLEDVASASKEEPAPAAEPEEEKPQQESEEEPPQESKPQEEAPQEPEPQEPEPAAQEEQQPQDEPASEESIEYVSGANIEDISEEKSISPEDASIEEEIKPFFEERSQAPEEPEPPQAEPVRDLDAEASEGGIEEEEPKPSFEGTQDKLEEQAQEEPAEDAASGFPEKFSLEGENKVGLFEYVSLAVGLGILGFFVYLLLKG